MDGNRIQAISYQFHRNLMAISYQSHIKLISIPAQMTQFLSSAFNSDSTFGISAAPVACFELDDPILFHEVKRAISRLSNNRSPGSDNICGEHYSFIREITHMINNQSDSIPLGAGVIVMIPKPNKPPRIVRH